MHPSFWIKIAYAATQGQLAHLELIPAPSSKCLEAYIYTALSFKNSLISLRIEDPGSSYQLNLTTLDAYKTLREQIPKFKNLRTLFKSYVSNEGLSEFDKLIDDCENLEDLRFLLSCEVERLNIVSPKASTILPRSKLYSFSCYWETINYDSQLNYIMEKFPNLKTLNVL